MKEPGKKDKKKIKKYKNDKNVWNEECERLLAEWSEKASCYRWLHGRSEKTYRKWYYGFSIPVIILSTLTGAANVGMDSFVPTESKAIASAAVGGVNIFAGIISTLQNFLKVAEYMEGHRIAGISWGKLQRNIAIELALDPSRRVLEGDFLKISRAEYDRLIEAGPLIDDNIIKQFNAKFKNYEVSVPSICNGLDKCNIYKIDPDIKPNKDDFTDGIEDIILNENIDLEPPKKLNIVKLSPGKNKDKLDIVIDIPEEEENKKSEEEQNKPEEGEEEQNKSEEEEEEQNKSEEEEGQNKSEEEEGQNKSEEEEEEKKPEEEKKCTCDKNTETNDNDTKDNIEIDINESESSEDNSGIIEFLDSIEGKP